MSTDLKKAAETTKASLARKAEEERQRMEGERNEHELALAVEAEARQSVLDKAMKTLTKEEQKQVRLQAAIICAVRGYSPQQKQAQHDDVALSLAKYMADGAV